MKLLNIGKTALLSLILISTSVCLKAQDSTKSSGGTTKVYFLRNTGMIGAISGFNVFIDDVPVCRINQNKFSLHDVTSGKHKFSVQFDGKKARPRAEKIEVEIQPGKTYYLELVIKMGVVTNTIYLREMEEKAGKAQLATMQQDDDCEVK